MKENPINKKPQNLSSVTQMTVLRKMFKSQVIATQLQIPVIQDYGLILIKLFVLTLINLS